MKYIQTYESMSDKGYKEGDYVYVTAPYFNIQMKPMIIDHIMIDENADGEDSILLNYLNGVQFDGQFIEDDIVRKLDEVEIAALKYNL